MSDWQNIWQGNGAKRLWSIPDRQVGALAAAWKADGSIHRVLDIGCGLGRHVRFLVREGFEVYGLDHSEAGLETCRRELAIEGRTAALRCGEMTEIPWPDGFFDAVVAFNSIYHGTADAVRGIVGLIGKRLRPGGACFATFPSRENRMYGRGKPLGPHTFVSPGMFGGVLGDDGERGVVHHFSDEEEVRSFFGGFRIESLEHTELHLASAHEARGAQAWVRIPRAFFWRVVARRFQACEASCC